MGKGGVNNLKNKIIKLFELPKEIVLNLPLISIVGNCEITIENYKGIIEYSTERIRVNTSCGILRVQGKVLCIKQITADCIKITGHITAMDYIL